MWHKRSKDEQSERLTKIFITIYALMSAMMLAVGIVVTYRWIGSDKPFDWEFWMMIAIGVSLCAVLMRNNIIFGRTHYWKAPVKKK